MEIETLLDYVCCPDCKGDLRKISDKLICSSCMREYLVEGSMIALLPKEEDQLEGRIRDRYDQTAGGGSAPSVFRLGSELLGEIEGKDVLDIGCSRGDFEFSYLMHGKPRVAIGIDFSRNAIEIANSKVSSEDNVAFIVGSALKLPLKSHKFDKILIMEVIEHLPNVDACIEEVKRVLKDDADAEIILSAPNYFNTVGILKKFVDRYYFKGQERFTYAQTEELERFLTPFILKRKFLAHNLRIASFRGSELYLGVRQALLFPSIVAEMVIRTMLSKIRLSLLTRFPFKYFGVVQFYVLKKGDLSEE